MLALVRYTAASVFSSQRYLPPLLLFLAALAVLTSNDDGPLVPQYAVSSAAVFCCATWWTVALFNAEDPAQRAIMAVTAGGAGRVLLAGIAVAVAGCVLLAGLGLAFPLVTGRHPVDAGTLALGGLAELTAGVTAVAIGLVCSRPVIRRPGYAAVAALALVLGLALVPGVPPVHPVFLLLAGGGAPAALLGPVALRLAVALGLLAASAVATGHVSRRRD